MNHPAEMFRYHTWANKRILERIKELPSSVLTETINNSSFPTIGHALNHIYAVDKTWYMVLTGTGMPEALQVCMPVSGKAIDSVEEYESIFNELSEQTNEWLAAQTDLEQSVMLENPYAGNRQTRLSEILFHLVNHGTYHRGNISTMLRQLGYPSVMTDYVLFWYQEPVSLR